LPLTQLETWYLNETIKGETLLCQKLAAYASQAQDQALRGLIQDLKDTCLRRVEMLASQVRG
jgi:hypothetical protein